MNSPFLDKEKILKNKHAFAIYDGFPVSKGHVLVIPNRQVKEIFELNNNEYEELTGQLSNNTNIVVNIAMKNDLPYVSIMNQNTNTILVQKYESDSWTDVGDLSSLSLSNIIGNHCLEFDSNGILYCSFTTGDITDPNSIHKITIIKYTTSWESLGYASDLYVHSMDIVFDSNGVFYSKL